MVIKRTTKKNAQKFAVDYVRYLKKNCRLPIKQAYLYGSYAKNRQRDWSDVDVAIISDKFKGRLDPLTFLWRSRRMKDIHRGIEPVGYHPRNFIDQDPLVWEIKEHGIPIKFDR